MEFQVFGALLVAVLISALPALVVPKTSLDFMRRFSGFWRNLAADELGVTITYAVPSTGVTPPTGQQAQQVNLIAAQVAIGDAETQATLTHNWGLPASFPGFFFPLVWYVCQVSSGVAQSFLTLLTFSWLNTNAIVINKLAGASTGGTFIVYVNRPSSFVR